MFRRGGGVGPAAALSGNETLSGNGSSAKKMRVLLVVVADAARLALCFSLHGR